MWASVLKFWFETLSLEDHFKQSDDLDDMIRTRFHDLWVMAAGGGLSDWQHDADSVLALIIVLDQFPRNMHRGSGQSFHSDALARQVAEQAFDDGFDRAHEEQKRLYFYLPFMHSELLADQDKCIYLISSKMPETGMSNLLHARAHRRIIRKFGRFPYRNEALGRTTSQEEVRWLEDGGYMRVVEQIEQQDKEQITQ